MLPAALGLLGGEAGSPTRRAAVAAMRGAIALEGDGVGFGVGLGVGAYM